MARVIIIKNTTGGDKTYAGQTVLASDEYTLQATEGDMFVADAMLFADVASGDAVINNGGADITDPTTAWAYLVGGAEKLPISDLEGHHLAVHPSYKPQIDGGTTYAVWTGAGDDVVTVPNVIGDGPLLHFDMQPGTPIVSKDVKFSTDFGRIWIHEAYLKFTGAGEGDYLTADVMAGATLIQDQANLDLVIEDDCVKYSQGGPGTGTHGFGGTPNLVPRSFSMDGDWDFDGVSLAPNFAGTGEYLICSVDRSVHRYVNKIPTFGDCPYFSMSSDETAELLPGYFLRVNCHNNSDSAWHISVIMEIYREKTV